MIYIFSIFFFFFEEEGGEEFSPFLEFSKFLCNPIGSDVRLIDTFLIIIKIRSKFQKMRITKFSTKHR